MTDFADIKPAFRQLVERDPFRLDRNPSPIRKGQAGVYCLYESDRALYVGRGRDLRQRLANHRSSSLTAASLAVKMARIEARQPARYTSETKAETLLTTCPPFKAAFERARARIQEMQVRYVEMNDGEDGVRQALLEIYAACELGTLVRCGGYNTFRTS